MHYNIPYGTMVYYVIILCHVTLYYRARPSHGGFLSTAIPCTNVLPYFPEPYSPENPWKPSCCYLSRVFRGFLAIKVLENKVKRVYIHVCVYIYIYTHIYAYIYTYTRIFVLTIPESPFGEKTSNSY